MMESILLSCEENPAKRAWVFVDP